MDRVPILVFDIYSTHDGLSSLTFSYIFICNKSIELKFCSWLHEQHREQNTCSNSYHIFSAPSSLGRQ